MCLLLCCNVGNRALNSKGLDFLPNSKKHSFFELELEPFEVIRKIFRLLKRNKRSLRNIFCCSVVTTTLTISMVLRDGHLSR